MAEAPVLQSGARSVERDDAPLVDVDVAPGQSRRLLSGWRLLSWRVGVLLGTLLLWEALSWTLVDERYISRPSAVLIRFVEWILDAEFWYHAWTTIWEALTGYLLGSALGAAVGFVLGLNHLLARAVSPVITALYAIPKVTLAPLFVLYFGIYEPSKIALATVIVFFLVFYSTFTGVHEVDRELVDAVLTMGANRWQVLHIVIVPAAMDWVMTGVRIALPYAFIGAVAGEIIISSRGLGYLIRTHTDQIDTTGAFAALVTLMLMTAALNEVVTRIHARTRYWRTVGHKAEQF
ncbi:MAG: ABC transporter permease [Chloroflexi bacterium]|nr:ABC transporter permease [Chloroflexota bacterium]